MTPSATHALTLSEAAEACGVHRSTVRRALDAGRFPRAWRDEGRDGPGTGPWRIPVDDLVAAGFTFTRADPEPEREPEPDEVERLRGEVEQLRRRAEVAEAQAAERAERIADLRLVLRAIGAGDDAAEDRTSAARTAAVEPVAPTGQDRAPKPARVGWWRRTFGGG